LFFYGTAIKIWYYPIIMNTESRDLQASFFKEMGNFCDILHAFEHLPDLMFMIKDRESRYIFMSRGLRKAIGVKFGINDEVIGKTDFDLFPKIVAQSYRLNDLLVLDQGRTLINEVHAGGPVGAGLPKWFFSSKFPIHDRTGNIIGLFTTNRPYNEVMGDDDDLNRLLPAIDHMSKEYSEKMSVAELATMCGFSESHFMRLFKQRLRMSSQKFLEQVRMFHAIEAIKTTHRTISDIAISCGFYDHSSFVKRFKRFTGTTPLCYRRELQDPLQIEPAMVLPKSPR